MQDKREHKQKLLDEEEITRRRKAILDTSALKDQALDILQRRAQRTEPQLMVIEDDSFSRKLFEVAIGDKYRLTSLGDARGALETYVRLAPDILFLDIELPDVTGHELLREILALDENAYVIIISAAAEHNNIIYSMGNGAKGFVTKPFNAQRIFQYIERCPTIKL